MLEIGWTMLSFLILFPFLLALSPDGITLLRIRNELQDPLNYLENWNASQPSPCDWIGVTCDNDIVTNLRLQDMNLTGNVSTIICELTRIKILDLSRNKFSGSIPSELANCRQLQVLNLSYNALFSEIPSGLGLLTNLIALDLSSNKLSGRIPKELGNLKSLGILNMFANFFSGSIPDEVGNMSSLRQLLIYAPNRFFAIIYRQSHEPGGSSSWIKFPLGKNST